LEGINSANLCVIESGPLVLSGQLIGVLTVDSSWQAVIALQSLVYIYQVRCNGIAFLLFDLPIQDNPIRV
jgi:hypothetical protein